MHSIYYFFFFFFNDTATTEIYTLSLHDALPIYGSSPRPNAHCDGRSQLDGARRGCTGTEWEPGLVDQDRKSTRLNSSHSQISYAVFCLKKKKSIYKESDSASTTTSFVTSHACIS